MANYTKAANFTAKDTTNDIISGAEFDTEFNALESSSATKADKVSPAVSGNLTAMDANGNLTDSGIPKTRSFYYVGGTDVAVADGGTGASTASGARTNLGLGTLATLSAVGAAEITDGSVGTVELANDAVTAAKIAAGAVGTTEIANGAVTSTEIATGAVTNAKIGTGAVTQDKVSWNTTGYNDFLLGASTAWTIPAGCYVLTTSHSTMQLEIYSGTAWKGGMSPSGAVISDGTNVRIYNSDTTGHIVYYRKLA